MPNPVTNGFAAFAPLAANLAVLRTRTASSISFSGSTIADSANGLAIFPAWTRVTVTGSAHNDGTYDVSASTAGALTVEQTLVAETAGASITLQWKFETVYADPRDAVVVTDFPSLVLALTPGQPHRWLIDAPGVGANYYSISLYVFMAVKGQASPPLTEIFAKVKPFVKAIADILLADLKLRAVTTGEIKFIGDGSQGSGSTFFRYQHGPMEWGEGLYWVLEITLPVAEYEIQAMA